MKRRTAISTGAIAMTLGIGSSEDRKHRIAVIGHTGRGNFGHGLDKVWLKMPETKMVAVADADEQGLAKAQKTLNVDEGFTDYRTMLKQVQPEFVAVCPRHPDQHAEMTLAAIEAGAKGIYLEKPFVRTLVEADQIKAACLKHGAKIAVAHRNRYHPDLNLIDKIIQNDGAMKIGKLLEIRGRGKGDHRGGGEDLWVLGSHVLDLITRFSGKPLSCSATILQDGRLATADDIRNSKEALGPIVGNEIHAQYQMENGITAFFDSLAKDETKNQGFGLQLIGSEGVVIIHCDKRPLAHFRKGNPLAPGNQSIWEPIGGNDLETIANVQNHVTPCRDLINAVEKKRHPVCGIAQATTTTEMVMGVFTSHFSEGKRVKFPSVERSHPLDKLTNN